MKTWMFVLLPVLVLPGVGCLFAISRYVRDSDLAERHKRLWEESRTTNL